MNWIEIAGLSICAASIPLGVLTGKWLKRKREREEAVERLANLPAPNLDAPEGREFLRMFIDRYEITGSADIRDGTVYRARRAGETDSMAAALMGVYRQIVEKTQNPNLAIYTVQQGTLIPLGSLSLSDLREIAQMLEDTRGR